MQAGNPQEVVEILLQTKVDVASYTKSLEDLKRKSDLVTKEREASETKINYIMNKNGQKLTEGAMASLKVQRDIYNNADKTLSIYKAQTAQIERTLNQTTATYKVQSNGLAAALGMGKQELAIQKAITEEKQKQAKISNLGVQATLSSTKSTNTKTMNTGSFSSASLGGSKQIDQIITKHDELNKKMREVDNTSKNTFPHKVSTTAQYMLAGAGIAGVVTALGNMVTAIMESDKAYNMFQGVLEMTSAQAKTLQSDIFNIGKTYGGNLSDLNESALALGRAGLASGQLAGALKVVSQAALISGDSLASVTELLVSWQTVHPEETIQHLGDIMTKVANDSLASFDDFKVMSNYLLTATASMGMTAESTIALAGAWRNLGKGASTTGTEIRRFMDQISNGSDDVKKAYASMGVNIDKVQKNMAQGGKVAEATILQFYRNIGEATKNNTQLAAEAGAKLQTLDKATFNSNVELAKQVELGNNQIGTAYERMLLSTRNATGALEEANAKVVVSYQVMWERIKNTMTAGSDTFAKAFKDGFIGSETSVKDFNSRMEEFDKSFNTIMDSVGSALGGLASIIVDVLPIITRLAEAFLFGATLVKLSSIISETALAFEIGLGTIVVAEGAATTSTKLFTTALLANPIFWTGAAIAASIYAVANALSFFFDTEKQGQINAEKSKNYVKQDAAYKQSHAYRIELIQVEIAKQEKLQASYQKGFDTFAKLNPNKANPYAISLKNTTNSINTMNKAMKEQIGLAEKAAGIKTVKDPKVDISGAPKLSDKDSNKEANEAARLAKDALELRLQELKTAEATYFQQNNITDQFKQQQYHAFTTLPLQEAAVKAATGINEYQKEVSKSVEDTARAQVEVTGKLIEASLAAEKQANITKLIASYKNDESLAGKINLEYEKKKLEIEADYLKSRKEASDLSIKDSADQVNSLEREQKLRDLARERSESLAKDAVSIKNQLDSFNFLSDYEKALGESTAKRLEIEQRYDKLIKEYPLHQKERLQLKEAELLILEKTLEANSTYYKVAMTGMDELSNQAVDFFDYQSEGWLDLGDIAQDVLHSMYMEMMKLMVIDPFTNWGKSLLMGGTGQGTVAGGGVFDSISKYVSGGSTGGIGAMLGLGTTDAMGFTTYSDGTVADAAGMITKVGSSGTMGGLGGQINQLSSLNSAYSLLSGGYASSLASGFGSAAGTAYNMGFTTIGDFLAGSASGAMGTTGAAGTMGAGQTAGMLANAAGQAAAAYIAQYYAGRGIDKLLGMDTYAGDVVGMVKDFGKFSTGEKIAVAALSMLPGGSLIAGGLIGKTKVKDSGLRFKTDVGAGQGFENIDSYVKYKKKSLFGSKTWYEQDPISEEQRKQIEGIFNTYDYLLNQLGSIEQVVIAAGRYSKDTFETAVTENFITAFTGVEQTITIMTGKFKKINGVLVEQTKTINNKEFTVIYNAWKDYAKSIDKTVTEAISESVNSFVSANRTFELWKLGENSIEGLAKKAEWATTSFNLLAETMGVSGITVDNFLEKQAEAIKKNFTPETLQQWQALGVALMSTTDAQKAYTEALGSSSSELSVLAIALSKIDTSPIATDIENQYNKLVELSNQFKAVSLNANTFIANINKQPATAASITDAINTAILPEDLTAAQGMIEELYATNTQKIMDYYSLLTQQQNEAYANQKAASIASLENQKVSIEAQKDAINLRIAALKEEQAVLEQLYNFASSIRNNILVSTNKSSILLSQFTSAFDLLKADVLAGRDTSTNLSATTDAASGYIETLSKTSVSSADFIYSQLQVAASLEAFQGTGQVSTLATLEAQLVALDTSIASIDARIQTLNSTTTKTADNTAAMNTAIAKLKADTVAQLQALITKSEALNLEVVGQLTDMELTSMKYLGVDSPIVRLLASINAGITPLGTTLSDFTLEQSMIAAKLAIDNINLINALYQKIVGRNADAAGMDYWLAQLKSGTVTTSNLESTMYNAAIANNEVPLYATGGYTGNMSTQDMAGIVHGQEYVVNAKTTKDLGLNNQGGIFRSLLSELEQLKTLTITLVANNTKQLQTQRAIYSQGEVV